MARKGEKQSPEYIAKRMASWKETRRKKGLPVSDDLVVAPFCACGCGQKVHKQPEKARWNTYITGHNRRGCTNGENQRKATSLARKGITPVISEEVERERRRKISMTMTGSIRTPEHRKHLSESLKKKFVEDPEYKEQRKRIGILLSAVNKGHVAWSKGLTKENHPSLMSTSNKLKELYKDKDKCPAWLGGISFLPYSADFNSAKKHEIKKRDGYACRECGNKPHNTDLHVHHIDYDKNNNEDNNLITLCNSCHGKTTIKNREIWKMYYKYKIGKENNFLLNKFNIIRSI